jgi:inhibitor of KinA
VNTTNHIYPCGDSAITISLGETMDVKINERVHQLFTYLKKYNTHWLDVIPAYTSVTVFYDSVAMQQHGISAPHQWVKEKLEQAAGASLNIRTENKRTLIIPVCYHASIAPDSKRVCDLNKISVEQLIKLHTQKSYRVFMIGFLPGFAYMGNVDDKIATPRLEKPRAQVAEGSVGIAGNQTGIYPLTSPGGWNIIGKTPVKLFDAAKALDENSPATLFQPGDEVIFKAISKAEFDIFDAKAFNPIQL